MGGYWIVEAESKEEVITALSCEGWRHHRNPPDCHRRRLRVEADIHKSRLGDIVKLVTPPGEVQVIIQRVNHDPRAHLDIETDSIPAEVKRLEALGAVLVSQKDGWVIMQAPPGHRFCVGMPYRSGFDENANAWGKMKSDPRLSVDGPRQRKLTGFAIWFRAAWAMQKA